ncbi:hypothetical protein FQN60_015878 [Etheostoma spectabile]|uniref:Uncharacterized protein n=1 Tax=Etheostoma spectabile TaxID=54343 RepID=A0A5J5CN19_9PERO|nr:hypothetical protein FQN60_015878 [Etheostoma spectabile]
MKYDHIPGPPRDKFSLRTFTTFLRIMSKGDNIHDTFLEWPRHMGLSAE